MTTHVVPLGKSDLDRSHLFSVLKWASILKKIVNGREERKYYTALPNPQTEFLLKQNKKYNRYDKYRFWRELERTQKSNK